MTYCSRNIFYLLKQKSNFMPRHSLVLQLGKITEIKQIFKFLYVELFPLISHIAKEIKEEVGVNTKEKKWRGET